MAKRKSKKTESPTCNCALLCDDVLVSARDKHVLSGVVGSVVVPHTPFLVAVPLVAYIRLSNVYPRQVVRVSLEQADDDRPVFEFQASLPDQSDPLGVYTLIVPIIPFEIQQTGRYLFAVRAKGDRVPLAQTPVLFVSQTGLAEPR